MQGQAGGDGDDLGHRARVVGLGEGADAPGLDDPLALGDHLVPAVDLAIDPLAKTATGQIRRRLCHVVVPQPLHIQRRPPVFPPKDQARDATTPDYSAWR